MGSVGLAPYTDDDDATTTCADPVAPHALQHLRACRWRWRGGRPPGRRATAAPTAGPPGARPRRAGQDGVEHVRVDDVALDERRVDAVEVGGEPGREVVERDHLVDAAGATSSAGTGWRR